MTREHFAVFIAQNPMAGSVVRGSGGVRKVRWAQKRKGKSGGARVIYLNRLDNGDIWLLTIYAKADRSTVPVTPAFGGQPRLVVLIGVCRARVCFGHK